MIGDNCVPINGLHFAADIRVPSKLKSGPRQRIVKTTPSCCSKRITTKICQDGHVPTPLLQLVQSLHSAHRKIQMMEVRCTDVPNSSINFTEIKNKMFPFVVHVLGLRSRISKVFNFVSRDKSQRSNNQLGSASAKNSFSMPRGSFSMLSRSDGYLDSGPRRSVDIPKLEITSPHNQELIRKYEKRYSIFENNNNGKPPALPPRKYSMNF